MKSWEDIAPERLSFPIGGKVYVIPELDYRSMLTVQKAKLGMPTELDGAPAEDSWRIIMGEAWDQMVEDNVPAEAIGRAGLATLVYFEKGMAAAESVWEHGLDPKALAAAIEAATEPSRPSNSAEANKTPRPASTSGMNSRRGGSKKKKRARTAAVTPS